jgi:hypothetical protein
VEHPLAVEAHCVEHPLAVEAHCVGLLNIFLICVSIYLSLYRVLKGI